MHHIQKPLPFVTEAMNRITIWHTYRKAIGNTYANKFRIEGNRMKWYNGFNIEPILNSGNS